ncbi:hypothetical protein M231_07033 [Tremella mesenterica]|uniref:Uncharacterized protein n=1 Tax=Tremella mesenterica TaxID=5217 RepID=A0A4Q1BEP7_TREME|nr:hypothetical protein M231_07033 [Tremella mesenterica]
MASVSSKILFENLPKLSHDPALYAQWRKSIEVYLQIGDAWNIVTGNDTEAGRVGVRPAAERAGSVPPTTPVKGQVIGRRITGEELKEWEKWQARENKAQGMIKGAVLDAVMLDLSEKMDDATAEEMAKHVEEFLKTMAEAELVGLNFDSQERAGLFLNTILAPSYRIIHMELKSEYKRDRTWDKVLTIFNAETARHKARPVGRTNRKGFTMFAEKDKGMRVNRDNISDGTEGTEVLG